MKFFLIKNMHALPIIFSSAVFVVILLLPSISYAGIIYTRTSIPPDNFSFDISFNDFGTDSGLGAGFTFWGLNMYNIDDVDIYQTESISTDTTQYVFTIARPNHHIKSIRFYACDMENNCSYEGVTIQDGAPLADAPVEDGGGGDISPDLGIDFLTQVSSGPTAYRPEVEIFSPKEGSIFGNEGVIVYKATDKNDSDSSKNLFGLIPKPVSIFYTDKIAEWNHTITKDEDKSLIEKNLPPVGSYLWKLSGLKEDKFYRVVVDAVDAFGEIGEFVSGFFSVDFTPPVFNIKADPQVVKNEDVTITVESSKDLITPPTVLVKQRGAVEVKLKVSGGGRIYTGVYSVIPLFDGTASVEVFGTDIAGNKGSVVVSGGTFSVGVNPPQKPTITSPLENEKIVEDKISIRGTAREDTEVTIKVNGVDSYTTKPNKNGDFLLENVLLKKNSANGVNTISATAKDTAQSFSESEVVHISYNLAPTIIILKPESNSILTATGTILIQASDDNGDRIRFRYEVAQDSRIIETSDWQTIADTPSDKLTFDTTELQDGGYFLRVIADDGATTTVSNAIKIRVKNELPFIGFDDGRRTVTSQKTVTIRGTITAPENISSRPNIMRLEYSTSGGKRWMAVLPTDGSFGSPVERFSVPFQNLKDGVNDVIWRTTDSRGFTAKVKHSIVVDTAPPEKPKITSPLNGDNLTEVNNETIGKGKFSFTISGKSEPGSTVVAEIDGSKFTGKSAFDGTFRIRGLTISSRGKYTMNVYAIDEAQNKSTVVSQSLIYDNPPKLVIINPRDGRGIPQEATLSWLASDPDDDVITNIILSYRRIGQPYIVLLKNGKENKLQWDTTKLVEGNDYELKLEASDGIVTSVIKTSFLVDRNPPALSSFDVKQKVYGKGGIFTAQGKAMDSFSGVEFVEYKFELVNSADSSAKVVTPWYKGKIISGFLEKTASFLINNTLLLSDGEYKVIARVVDASGNVSEEKYQTIIVDATPPRIGSFVVQSGDINLLPQNKIFTVPTKTKLALTLSLEKDTKSALVEISGEKIPLQKNLATGLWQASFVTETIGTTTIFVTAKDNLGNTTKKQTLFEMNVVNQGHITTEEGDKKISLTDASIHVSRTTAGDNFLSRLFAVKSEEIYMSDKDGNYSFILPAGTYRISLQKNGFITKEISSVVLNTPTFVTDNFNLEPEPNKTSYFKRFLKMLHL